VQFALEKYKLDTKIAFWYHCMAMLLIKDINSYVSFFLLILIVKYHFTVKYVIFWLICVMKYSRSISTGNILVDISKEYYQLQKYLERLICTLVFELFIVSGLLELKATISNDRWLASSFRNSFIRATHHQGCLVWTHSSYSFVGLHTCLKYLHVTPWSFVWESRVSTLLDAIICV
jgi:hypothetical protein